MAFGEAVGADAFMAIGITLYDTHEGKEKERAIRYY
jgi:hypothetical protein